MSKTIFPSKYIFAFACALLFAVQTFGQTADLQADLNRSFSKFNLTRLDARTARQRVESQQSLIVASSERNYELNLTAHDLRSANYRAEETTANGARVLDKNSITTFKGTIAGEAASQVRLTIDASGVEGYFFTATEKFYIEPARRFSRLAGASDVVIYRHEDLLKTDGFACHSDVEEKLERGSQIVAARDFDRPQTLKVLEIATDADFEFVTMLGGAGAANAEILSILNMTEGVFETELGLTINVTYQHAWSTPDAYVAANQTALLAAFKDYWNVNYPLAQVQRDTAHLFTGKAYALSQGYAYIGVVCSNQANAYGLSGRIDWSPAKFLITTHELGHNLGANHVDAAQSCANTLMNAALSGATPLSFCSYSQTEIANFTANGACLAPQASRAGCDFDGDGKSDYALFRPANGVWYLTKSANGAFDYKQFGAATDKLVPADYDGDGKTDFAVFRAGTWYRFKSTTNTFDGAAFGAATDLPAPADFDGDGKADLAVFRPADGVWHRLMSGSNSYTGVQFGAIGDVPLPGDFDGDGKADLNVFRPTSGAWLRLNSQNGAFVGAQFGAIGDKPLAADFDGDGKADLAVFRPATGGWYRVTSSNNQFNALSFGAATDIPTAADFDGDGKTDIAVFRPSDGNWYRFNSSTGAFVAFQFGGAGDIPAQSYYLP